MSLTPQQRLRLAALVLLLILAAVALVLNLLGGVGALGVLTNLVVLGLISWSLVGLAGDVQRTRREDAEHTDVPNSSN